MTEACHPRSDARGAKVPDGAIVALVGRPNAGKSSLYNRVTGGDARVGNFPGITVDILEAEADLPDAQGAVTIVDLPGLYSFESAKDPDTDEGVTTAFLAKAEAQSAPFAVLQVLDATQLALSLRLTRELLSRASRVALVVSQSDVLDREGRRCDAAALAAAVGVPVVLASARESSSREAVLELCARLLREPAQDRAARVAFDPDAVAAKVITDKSTVADREKARRARTERIDRWMLHPVLGPALFLLTMTLLFAAVFLVAEPASGALDAATKWLGAKLSPKLGGGYFASFVTDGLIGGAGTVLAFLPQIVVLTLALELLDASGYLARGVFLVDRMLRVFGLGGKALVPLLTAHACAVPAIRATRILRDPKERLRTLLVLPLMTCSARVPTYSLLISTFFAHRGALFQSALFVALYAAGIVAGAVASAAVRKTVVKGRPLPLVLEMPAYRAPEPAFVRKATVRGVRGFLADVGSTIVVASALLWVLLNVPMPGSRPDPALAGAPAAVVRVNQSVAASAGRAIEPVTRLAGFDWRINVGLMGSFGARELMVGTLGVIHGLEDVEDDTAPLRTQLRDARGPDGRRRYDSKTALALLAFFVIACQCTSTVAALKRETRTWRWPLFVLAYTYAAAFVLAVVVYRVAGLF
jgi:ferrous iron transport protein B